MSASGTLTNPKSASEGPDIKEDDDDLAMSALSLHHRPSITEMLPPELLILIISFIRTPFDLAALSRSCKALHTISEKALYHTLRFMNLGGESLRKYQGETVADLSSRSPNPGGDEEQDLYELDEQSLGERFFRNLPRADHARFIVSLTVTLGQSRPCVTFVTSSDEPDKPQGRGCTCDEYDAIFGKAMEAMTSLQFLQLICDLCSAAGQVGVDRHQYLVGPDARPLKSLSYQCGCMTRGGWYISQLLSSPLCLDVQAILLDLVTQPIESDQIGQSALQTTLLDANDEETGSKRVLSKIQTLGQNGTWYSTMIMRYRALERIGLVTFFEDWPVKESMHECLVTGPGAVEGTLNTFYTDKIVEWGELMKINVEPYRNIVELGTFTFPQEPDESSVQEISFLLLLKRLRLVHVNRRNPSVSGFKPYEVTNTFVTALGVRHPNLQYVRVCNRPRSLGDPPSVLWERKRMREDGVVGGADDEWTSYVLRTAIHTYWDVIKGRDEF